MSIDERSRRRVEDALARLRSEYGAFETVDEQWTVTDAEYETLLDRFQRGTVGGAGAWVANADGEVLLVRHEGEEAWSEPSGKHEPGETLEETARREVAEETNVACTLTGVELAERVAVTTRRRPPLVRLIVVFSAGYNGGTPEPADGEIAEVAWWDEHPSPLLYEALNRLPIPVDTGNADAG